MKNNETLREAIFRAMRAATPRGKVENQRFDTQVYGQRQSGNLGGATPGKKNPPPDLFKSTARWGQR